MVLLIGNNLQKLKDKDYKAITCIRTKIIIPILDRYPLLTGICRQQISVCKASLSLVFVVQGPPGAQGKTGPRGFKGRRVSLDAINLKAHQLAETSVVFH